MFEPLTPGAPLVAPAPGDLTSGDAVSSESYSSAAVVVVAAAWRGDEPIVTVTARAGAEQDESHVRLAISGRLCQDSCDAIRTELTARAAAAKYLTVDLANVTQLGAAGFSLLLDIHRVLAERGGFLLLDNPSPDVRRVLDVLHWEEVSRLVQLQATSGWPGSNRRAYTQYPQRRP